MCGERPEAGHGRHLNSWPSGSKDGEILFSGPKGAGAVARLLSRTRGRNRAGGRPRSTRERSPEMSAAATSKNSWPSADSDAILTVEVVLEPATNRYRLIEGNDPVEFRLGQHRPEFQEGQRAPVGVGRDPLSLFE